MKTLVIIIGAFLVVSLLGLAADAGYQEVFAEKAEGSPGSVPPHSYGSATKNIVCGGTLCSEIVEQKRS